MEPLLRYDLESHGSGATLYLTGALSVAGSRLALEAVQGLPHRVRALRIDMRGIRLFDPDALHLLAGQLRDWRRSRSGITRVKLPRTLWPVYHTPESCAS